jgi:DNA polymerase III alpha subunit
LQSQDNDEKRRDYITEAINHGVEVMPLTLNKSRETFDIVDEKIYVGFGNIKGIGEDKAKRIAEMQPYSGLKDFMDRYGTEAGTLKPLIGLRIFGDNILELYAYYLKYVEFRKQVKDKEKRFETKCKETFDILKSLLPEKMRSSLEKVPKLTTELFDVILNYLDKKGFDKKSDVVVAVSALAKKFSQALGRYNAGLEKAQEPKLGELNIEDCTEADDKLVNLYKSVKECELAYYGFLWTNDVKKSSKYKAGFNFDIAKRKNLSRPQPYYLVFGIIQSCQIKSFKSGKGKFASVELIDENMHVGRVTVWEDDYNIFKDDLSKGNLVSMQVTVSQGFQGFTLYGPPKHKRHALPARQYDTRVVVLEESSDG